MVPGRKPLSLFGRARAAREEHKCGTNRNTRPPEPGPYHNKTGGGGVKSSEKSGLRDLNPRPLVPQLSTGCS